MKNKFFLLFLLLFLLLIYFIFRISVQDRSDIYKKTEFMMDTYVTIKIPGSGPEIKKSAASALKAMKKVDKKFNMLNPSSPLYRYNEEAIPVKSSGIVTLVKEAVNVSQKTGGAFDITVKPIVELWGFYGSDPSLPDKKAIRETLTRVGYQKLKVKDGVLYKNRKDDIQIDLGAIAKGYALEKGIEVLKKEGIKSALIDAGGDIAGYGKLKDNNWLIGIRDPLKDGIIGVLTLKKGAVVTSGNYERGFKYKGKNYHHIIDPRTGYPAESGTVSVTVVALKPEIADAWATGLFVIGPEKGIELAEKEDNVEALFIDKNGKISYTSGLGDIFKRDDE